MDPNDLMNTLQSKFDAQSEAIPSMIQTSMYSHSDYFHSTLHRPLLEVDSKVAELWVEVSSTPQPIMGRFHTRLSSLFRALMVLNGLIIPN